MAAHRRLALALGGCTLGVVMCRSPVRPADALDGTYRLEVRSGCAALPAEARFRTYVATIQGSTVTLSGATFWMHPTLGLQNTFSIDLAGDTVSLAIDRRGTSDARGIVEAADASNYFQIRGTGVGSVDRSGRGHRMVGTFLAEFGFGADLADHTRHAFCFAPDHTATFEFIPEPVSASPPGVAPTPIRIEVVGPDSVAAGAGAEFKAMGYLATGGALDLTREAIWTSSNTLAATIAPEGGGIVTGRAPGDTTVSARIAAPNLALGLRSARAIIVNPASSPDGFRLTGLVTSNDGTPLVGATVEATSGRAAGLSVTTDWDGKYWLYGVSGETDVRVSSPGYADQVYHVSGTSHATLDVTMTRTAAIPDVAGSYTLTIAADPACASPIPDTHRLRSYAAIVTQNQRALTVALQGDWRSSGAAGRFTGTIDSAFALFTLQPGDDFEHLPGDLVERVAPNAYITIWGRALVSVSAAQLAGTLQGVVRFERSEQGFGSEFADCTSNSHQFVLSR